MTPRRCSREGCERTIPQRSHRNTCSSNCSVLRRVIRENQRITALIGPGRAADDLADAEADLIESYNHVLQVRKNIRLTANGVGIDTATWHATLRNQPTE